MSQLLPFWTSLETLILKVQFQAKYQEKF